MRFGWFMRLDLCRRFLEPRVHLGGYRRVVPAGLLTPTHQHTTPQVCLSCCMIRILTRLQQAIDNAASDIYESHIDENLSSLTLLEKLESHVAYHRYRFLVVTGNIVGSLLSCINRRRQSRLSKHRFTYDDRI